MSQAIQCPKCNGKGELEMAWGEPMDLIRFSKEYNDCQKAIIPGYDTYEIRGTVGTRTRVTCPLCKGSGVVFVSPAIIEGNV